MKLLKFLFKYYLFRSTYNVENIRRIILWQGFKIYPYRLISQNNPVTKLIDDLGTTEYAGHHSAFVATSPIIKGVFIKKDLSAADQNKLLFHEEAHIWYNDPNMTSFTDNTDVQQEDRACLFLFKLRLLKAGIYGAALVLLIWLVMFLAGAAH